MGTPDDDEELLDDELEDCVSGVTEPVSTASGGWEPVSIAESLAVELEAPVSEITDCVSAESRTLEPVSAPRSPTESVAASPLSDRESPTL
jgi:hypothetical protein